MKTYIDICIDIIAYKIWTVGIKANITETIIMNGHWKVSIVFTHRNFISTRLIDRELSFNVDITIIE